MNRILMKVVDSSMTLAIVGNVLAAIFLVFQTGVQFPALVIPLIILSVINLAEDLVVTIMTKGGRFMTFLKGVNFALDAFAIGLILTGSGLWHSMAGYPMLQPIISAIIWALAVVFVLDAAISSTEYALLK